VLALIEKHFVKSDAIVCSVLNLPSSVSVWRLRAKIQRKGKELPSEIAIVCVWKNKVLEPESDLPILFQ
jgi:hypothetical protein